MTTEFTQDEKHLLAALPHAIGAQTAFPGRQVVALAGDGGLTMLFGELVTLLQNRLPVTLAVFNNSSLNFVELEMKAAGIVTFGTDLVNPDFAAVARSMGMFGRRVEAPGDLEGALAEALAHDGPAVVDVVTARQELSIPPAITAEQARNATLAPDDPGKAESDGELQALRAQLTTLQSSGGDQLSVLAAPDEDPSPVSPKPVSEALVAALVTLLVVAELIVLLRGRLGKRPNRTWARRISRKHGAHFDASTTAPGEFDPLTSAKLVQALRDGRPALLLIGDRAAAPQRSAPPCAVALGDHPLEGHTRDDAPIGLAPRRIEHPRQSADIPLAGPADARGARAHGRACGYGWSHPPARKSPA
mgnify:CR=1 FL=1